MRNGGGFGRDLISNRYDKAGRLSLGFQLWDERKDCGLLPLYLGVLFAEWIDIETE